MIIRALFKQTFKTNARQLYLSNYINFFTWNKFVVNTKTTSKEQEYFGRIRIWHRTMYFKRLDPDPEKCRVEIPQHTCHTQELACHMAISEQFFLPLYLHLPGFQTIWLTACMGQASGYFNHVALCRTAKFRTIFYYYLAIPCEALELFVRDWATASCWGVVWRAAALECLTSC